MEQMVEINGWRDHHQVDTPKALYPGEMKPAVCMYWISSICEAIRDYLEVVPAMFNNCNDILSQEEETKARDLYWQVVLAEKTLSESAKLELLNDTISSNPFIAEPHVLLA